MKLKLTPLYLLSLMILVFLVHEIHDWTHFLVARAVCPCWGSRVFDGWDFCAGCAVSKGQRSVASLAGPVVNYLLLWVGWRLMEEENQPEQVSLGISLVFASLPFNTLLAAAEGGGDLTNGLRLLTQSDHTTNRHLVSPMGLLFNLVLIVPPLVRAFMRLPGYTGKFIVFPILLLLPGWLDQQLVGNWLNKWLIGGDQQHAFAWVIGWFVLLAAGWLLTRRQLEGLITELQI